MLIQTRLQGTNHIRTKAKDMISCVDALEKHFDSCPSDVAQQRHRWEVIRYATICPTVLDAESFPACSRVSRESYLLITVKTMEIYVNFSKMYERLYLATRFDCDHDDRVDVNRDNRSNGKKWSTIESVN